MTDNPADALELTARLGKQAEDSSPLLHGFYDELCKIDNLQRAYAQIKEDFQELGIDALALETSEKNGVEKFLQQLSAELQARTYHPASPSQQPVAKRSPEGPDSLVIRDLVVQVALKLLLEAVFPSDLPCDPEPEKAVKWVAGVIEKGLSRVYAVNLNDCSDAGQHERLVERASRRINDPELIGLLKEIVAASAQSGHSQQGLLAALLADIAFEGIDQLLQQARALGREGNFLHVHAARVGNEIVVLSDHDSRYSWLLAAVQKRLREELSQLHYDLASVQSQSVDLMRGEKLRFLGFELRSVTGKRGESRVRYQLLEEPARRQPESTQPRRRRQWRYHPLRFVRRCSSWIGRQRSGQFVQNAYHKANSIRAGWRDLPIGLYPVLAFFFGWRSPVALLCLALVFVFNWRRIPVVVRWARRRWPDTMVGTCVIAALNGRTLADCPSRSCVCRGRR